MTRPNPNLSAIVNDIGETLTNALANVAIHGSRIYISERDNTPEYRTLFYVPDGVVMLEFVVRLAKPCPICGREPGRDHLQHPTHERNVRW